VQVLELGDGKVWQIKVLTFFDRRDGKLLLRDKEGCGDSGVGFGRHVLTRSRLVD
jgi:hypothetical protein